MNLANKLKSRFECSSNQFVIYISLFFTFVLNFTFLSKASQIIMQLDNYSLGFLLSVPVVLFCLLAIFFTLFTVPFLGRLFVLVITIISIFVFYSSITYGTVFDYGMIQNTLETNSGEALSYLNWHSFSVISLMIVGVVVFLLKIKIVFKRPLKELLSKVLFIVCLLSVIGIIGKFYYADYSATGRNNNYIQKEIIPLEFIDGGYTFIRNTYFRAPKVFKVLDKAPELITAGSKPKVTILVVGETARAKNFNYSGYPRQTNAYTQNYGVTYFSNVSSCGTATAVSVPCMFSAQTHDSFSRVETDHQQNLLDIEKLAGADVLWVENDGGCKGVCNRQATVTVKPEENKQFCDGTSCMDEILLAKLQTKLNNIQAPSTFIVLHEMGSHGPTYFKRYPDNMRKFMPDCQQSDIQNCTAEELVNTYDNTILYSDFVHAQILEMLDSYSQRYDLAFVYVSDHGESLGENGAYLHGFPYAFAPDEQTHVPMYFWASYKQDEFKRCLSGEQDSKLSQDNIFHSMIGLTGVQTKALNPNLNIFNKCNIYG
ncbi:MAG: phosphoethanolamine--lipid A transferase [Psychromonas sp.]|nr:phosphoethanolamine--lipid A transferase [Psychromonas sp.]